MISPTSKFKNEHLMFNNAHTEQASGNDIPSDGGLVQESIVIPAYRGRSTIGECIESLLVAAGGRQVEILVVESSQDGTVEWVRGTYPQVRVIASQSQLSAGGARNRGVEESEGERIYFVDQDCVVPSDWMQRLSERLEQEGVGIAGGAIGFRNWSNLSGSAVFFLEFLYHFPSRIGFSTNQNFLLGCNLACRREVFETVRFPEQTLAEDVLFSSRVQRAGWKVVYDPGIVVLHWNRSGWGEFFRYNAKMGRASANAQCSMRPKGSEFIFKFPILIFFSPAKILPKIAYSLFGQWRYFFRFLLVSPMCLLGNWVWGWSFYRELRRQSRVQS